MTTLQFHPLSELFPLLEGQAFADLVEDIRENGVREPVWLYQGQVLDGRNRLRAAEAAAREAPSRVYDGDHPLKFVLSLNMQRRHLDESQRSMVAARIAKLEEGRPPASAIASGEAVTQGEAAAIMKVGRSSVQRARKVIERAAPEVVTAVDRGELEVKAAAEIADAPQAEQTAAMSEGKAGVKQLRRKVKAAAAPTPSTKVHQLERAVGAVRTLREVIDAKAITPARLVQVLPYAFTSGSSLPKFVGQCVKLAAAYERKLTSERRKWIAARGKERAQALRAAQAKHKRQAKKKAKAARPRVKASSVKRPRTKRPIVRKPARRVNHAAAAV